MSWDLPQALTVGGVSYPIRSDFRAILDICAALNDPELTDREKSYVVLYIFYPGLSSMPSMQYEEAIKQCFWFIDYGNNPIPKAQSLRLMDWSQDYKYISAPINRVLGWEIRGQEYLHWWTFLAAYLEIGGDCLFAQVVGIRSKLAKGKKLDKAERDFYNRNRDIIDIKTTYSQAEDNVLAAWGVK